MMAREDKREQGKGFESLKTRIIGCMGGAFIGIYTKRRIITMQQQVAAIETSNPRPFLELPFLYIQHLHALLHLLLLLLFLFAL